MNNNAAGAVLATGELGGRQTKTWLITGASRGFGREFARAALRRGDDVAATAVVTVLLVDDHAVVRQGLRAFFDMLPDVEVVGEADDGAAALRELALLRAAGSPPDVIVIAPSEPLPSARRTQPVAHPGPRRGRLRRRRPPGHCQGGAGTRGCSRTRCSARRPSRNNLHRRSGVINSVGRRASPAEGRTRPSDLDA